MKRSALIALLILTPGIYAQTKDPAKILSAVRQKFEKISDYEVDVNIKVDINYIKVPDSKAKLFFKQPDKVKIESAGFAMLPKNGVNFAPTQFLKDEYNSIYVRQEVSGGKKLYVVKVIPNSDTSDVILSTLWIDTELNIIRKVETTGKKGGTTTIELKYADNGSALPSEVKFFFNFGNFQVSPGINSGENEQDSKKTKGRGSLKGTVILTYENYKVNMGIPDAVFNEKKNSH